ncbi:hypothetical protein V492_06078 [Pseudogymnoascus sp. VKM F-4246]|nr:hypothetical protein V492_06078 [Pseudogymnoascus sp. VKM F-4246]
MNIIMDGIEDNCSQKLYRRKRQATEDIKAETEELEAQENQRQSEIDAVFDDAKLTGTARDAYENAATTVHSRRRSRSCHRHFLLLPSISATVRVVTAADTIRYFRTSSDVTSRGRKKKETIVPNLQRRDAQTAPLYL